MKTKYASAERVSRDKIELQYSTLNNIGHLKNILDAASIIFFIVNEQRQIVFSNQHFLERMNIDKVEQILGLRPGETMGCVNAKNDYSGCGTSEACRSCGMVGSIISAIEDNKRVVRETNVVLDDEKSTQLSLEVTASPFYQEGQRFIYFSAIDIEQKKRKEMMENIFFHDVLNLMTSLEGYLDMMENVNEDEKARYFPKVKHISNQLLEEIVSQQDLLKAENGKLSVNPKIVNARQVLEDVRAQLLFIRAASAKNILIESECESCDMVTDEVLLVRVLGNMLKNALEATQNGDTIKMGCVQVEDKFLFRVHNPGIIPQLLQHQIFQRSVSTKGTGRGLGTYSMKLLGEGYLKGRVWFESNAENQTTFFMEVPKCLV